jgi:hypothetical protein
MARMKLSRSDWLEIYYALLRRVSEIEAGRLDDEPGEIRHRESETAKWAANLRSIMSRIASSKDSVYLP